MLSRRFFAFNAFMEKLSRRLGTCQAKWDPKQLQFTRERLTVKVRFNASCILLWDAFHVGRLYQFRVLRDHDNFNIVFAFTVAVFLLNVGFLIATCYQQECVIATNAMFYYLRRVNGKPTIIC